MNGQDAVVLRWVADVMACGAVTVVRSLREGGSRSSCKSLTGRWCFASGNLAVRRYL